MLVKLTTEHQSLVKELIDSTQVRSLNALGYMIFNGMYLSNLNNFHAYGYIVNDELQSIISFYESDEDPAWYCTNYYGDITNLIDSVILHNENNGRLKFYTLVSYNSFWDKYQSERYHYVNELSVMAKTRCNYTNHWEVLFNRNLPSTDTIVRCYFLKQQYRNI